MTREVPSSKAATLWRGNGRWFRTRFAAYRSIAKALVLKRYPRWLEDALHDGDMQALAKSAGIADWHTRLDRRIELLWTDRAVHFDPKRWRRLVHRLARFLMFVDARRAEISP